MIRFAGAETAGSGAESARWASGEGTEVMVPEVSGLSARSAVRRLHTAVLRVVWDAPGPVLGTWPTAGTLLMQGDTVSIDVGRIERGQSR